MNDREKDAHKTRVGYLSRIDFPGNGFRLALLKLAEQIFKTEDVHYVALVGGLISKQYVTKVRKELGIKLKETDREIKALVTREAATKPSADARKTRKRTAKASAKRPAPLTDDDRAKLEELRQRREQLAKRLARLTTEGLTDELAKLLPKFTNAKGDVVDLYIIPSPACDGVIGDVVAHRLAKIRSDVRVYSAGSDTLVLRQAKKVQEALGPTKASWRSDYHSTPVERLLKDRKMQRSTAHPDFYAVGGFASSILKPPGEVVRPYLSIPALHRLEDTNTSENQIGVTVAQFVHEHDVPIVRNFSLKDYVSRERHFISDPPRLSKTGGRILNEIREHGRLPTGELADKLRLTRETVRQELEKYVIRGGSRNKTWAGVVYDKESRRWDFDVSWVRQHLRYPAFPTDLVEDSMVVYGCLHGGSVNTDYEFFQRMIPKIILDRDATILAGVGDMVEGLKHNLALRGETLPGHDVADMEELVADLLVDATMEVFNVRFPARLAAYRMANNGKPPEGKELAALVADAIVTHLIIPGNHDLWIVDVGWKPLVYMKAVMLLRLTARIDATLAKHGLMLRAQQLQTLLDAKIVEPERGVTKTKRYAKATYVLPTGLTLTMLHPHMARAKTTSLRPQEMLEMARDSHLVLGANFHVGEFISVWDGDFGQRCCMQIGTMKHGTDFERNKLKIVDQGFGYLKVGSKDRRILRTEATFFNSDPDTAIMLNPREIASLIRERIMPARKPGG